MPSPARSLSRWLAPLALIACAVAVFAIVSGGPSGPTKASTTQQQPAAQRDSHGKKSTSGKKSSSGARTYTVQPGDTLSGIAAKTGVSLDRIQQLNPTLDSQALQTGQKVKLGP